MRKFLVLAFPSLQRVAGMADESEPGFGITGKWTARKTMGPVAMIAKRAVYGFSLLSELGTPPSGVDTSPSSSPPPPGVGSSALGPASGPPNAFH